MNKAIERFERYLQRRYGDRSTPKHYLSDMRIFVQCIGDKSPIEVTVQDIDAFVDRQVARGLSPTTVNRRLATLRTFFEFLAAEDPDCSWPNPVNWRRHGIKEGEPLPRDLSDADVERLFAAIKDDRDRALFGLMLNAGLRVGEVVTVRLQDLEPPTASDQPAPLRVCGKGHKERLVWLTPRLYAAVQTWLQERPDSDHPQLFLNQHGRPLSVSGVQYRLKQHIRRAGIHATCHQLRHTFARRLVEQEMPIESISKLLGHAQVRTTEIYTAGADPQLRDAFTEAMAQLEASSHMSDASTSDSNLPPAPPREPERADPAELEASFSYFDDLPSWLQEPLRVYLSHRWRNWQPHVAPRHARRLARQLRRIWRWLLGHRALNGWSDLKRSDVEAWMDARQGAGLAASSRITELSDLRSFLYFVTERGLSLDANLFRIPYPERGEQLPRYLEETEYRRLEQVVLEQTAGETLTNARDRAWFFTLAHTGLRVSELVNLRLADVDLAGRRLIVRGGKNKRDRVVYLAPTLTQALKTHLAHRKKGGNDHVWLDDGKPLKTAQVRYRLRRWGEQCDVAVTPHRLRHTLATRLINQGMSLEALRKLLGHKTLRMTQRYAYLHDVTVREQFQIAMANIEGIAVNDWPQQEDIPTGIDLPVMLRIDSV